MGTPIRQPHLFPGIMLLVLSLVLLPSRYLGWLRPLEKAAAALLRPGLTLASYAKERLIAGVSSFFYLNDWERKYRQIQAQNWTLINEVMHLRRLYQDDLERERLLQHTQALVPQLTVAKITATIKEGAELMWLINKGSEDGLEKNLPVLGSSGRNTALVGKIFQVQSHSAVVIPLLHPLGNVTARLQQSQFTGLVHGGSWLLEMNYISRLAQGEIQPGELVVTAGLEHSLFPAGIPIGKVIRVDDTGYEASISLQLSPLLDISQLQYLQIMGRPEGEV